MKVDYFTDQGVGLMNEDDFLVQDNLFCVFDGVTSLVKYVDQDGKTGGWLGSHLVREIFEANRKKPLLTIAKLANEKLRAEMIKRNIDVTNKLNLWGAALATVRIENGIADYMQVGDSPILFIDKDEKITSIMSTHGIDQETLVLWKKLVDDGVSDVKNDKRIIEVRDRVRRGVNINYGTLNGEEEVFNFVTTGKVSIGDIKHILLLTDGVKVLQENPEEDEDMTDLTNIFLQRGLKAILEYVRSTENKDPECRKYIRSKTHDDATAIGISKL